MSSFFSLFGPEKICLSEVWLSLLLRQKRDMFPALFALEYELFFPCASDPSFL